MRNYLLIVVIIFFTILSQQGRAQCTSGLFSIPDSICPEQIIPIDNSISTANSYNWDFCIGDLDSIPTGTVLGNISGSLSFPQAMKIVYDNGNYYGFVCNVTATYITRYEFGNSLMNTPIVTSLTSNSLIGGAATGIDMVKESNTWYAFITMFSANTVIRLSLDSIMDIDPDVVNLNVTTMSSARSIKIINGYGFIVNYGTTEITRINFNGSYGNIPVVESPGISVGAFGSFGIDIAYDCSINKYIGFVSSYSSSTLFKLDFGSSISNLATVSPTGVVIPSVQGLQIIKEAEAWRIFAVTNSSVLYNFTVGNSLDNTVVDNYNTTLGGIMADPINIQLEKSGTNWIGIMPNNQLQSTVRITFPQGCQSINTFSYLQSPDSIQIAINDTGYVQYELIETFANGTTQVISDSIFVNIAPPEADFRNSSLCVNAPVQFYDSSKICYGSITNWLWDFGNGQTSTIQDPTTNYLSPGNYNVTLTITSDLNVTNSITKQITIYNKPTALFSVTDSACVAASVNIIDASTSVDGNVTVWNWSLGDLTFQTLQNITHEYILSGDYTIQLIATTNLGCSDTISKIINIKPGPIANFVVNNTCVGETVQFTDSSVVAGTTISNYQWNFGDGNFSTTQNPINTYPSTTTSYNVELIINAINGCSDTIVSNIRIGNKPNVWFSMSSDTICAFSDLTLTDSSFAGSGDVISNRNWDFGDGQTDSNNIQVTHSYTLPGIYTISLQVISPQDCDSIVTRTIVVIDNPTANFSFTNACFGISNTFTNLSSAPAGSIISSFDWAFGDGSSSSTNNTIHTFLNPGIYTTSLIVTSNFGCLDSIKKQVEVYSIPTVNFTYSKACTNKPIQFNDSSYVTGSSISGWQWSSSSSGASSTIQNPSFSFPNNFVYDVKLIVTTLQGCIDSITKFLIVDQTPDFSISTTDHCEGSTTQFQYIPSPGSSSNMAYLWTFGDNTASFLSNPTHQFSSAGEYDVTLQVTNLTNTCSNTLVDSIFVYPLPLAAFANSEACIGQPLQIFDQSTIPNGSISNWKWALGATTSTQQNPSFNLTNSGIYNLKLVVTSSFGCKDSTAGTATINSLPHVEFTPSSLFGAPPLFLQFDNSSSLGTYTWLFGDNTSGSNLSEPTHSYLDTGVYIITLTTIDSNGCIDSAKKNVYVQIPYPDLAIKGTSFTSIQGQWNMKAIIANTGNITATKFKLKAQLDGKSTFVQTFDNLNLDPGEINEFTFSTTFADDFEIPSFFCGEIISINDTIDLVASNNRFCNTTSTEFDVISVYPNPFNDNLYLGINMPAERKITVILTDIQGRSLGYENQYQLSKGFSTIQLPTIKLAASIYLLKIKLGDKEKIIKIIKN